MPRTRKVKAVIEAEDQASSVFGSVGSSLKALGAVAAAVGAAQLGRKLVAGIGKAVDAAAVQEDAEVSLAAALRARGRAVDETLPALKEYASALQDVTGVGDELILNSQRLLISIGDLEGEGLQRATAAALDLAAALQVDQRTAFDLVAKAASGYTSTLSRYGIIIDKNLKESEKFGAALDKIEESFSGAAAQALTSYTGRLGELQGRFGDLQEVIGGPFRDVIKEVFGELLSPLVKDITTFADSGAFRESIIKIAISFAELAVAIEALKPQLDGVLDAINKTDYGEAAATVDLLSTTVIDGGKRTSLGASLMRSAFDSLAGITDVFNPGITAAGFTDLADGIEQTVGVAEAAPSRLQSLLDSLNALLETTEDLSEANKDVAESWEDTLEIIGRKALDVQATLESALAGGTFGEGVGFDFTTDIYASTEATEALNKQVLKLGKTTKTLGSTLTGALIGQGVSAAGLLASTLTDAAFGAEASFRSFFKSLAAGLLRAMIQAIALRAILAATSFGAGAALSPAISPLIGFSGVGMATGGLVTGGTPGRDSVPALLTPGEMVLSRDVTDALLAGNTSGPSIQIDARGALFPDSKAPARLARFIAQATAQGNRLAVQGA